MVSGVVSRFSSELGLVTQAVTNTVVQKKTQPQLFPVGADNGTVNGAVNGTVEKARRYVQSPGLTQQPVFTPAFFPLRSRKTQPVEAPRTELLEVPEPESQSDLEAFASFGQLCGLMLAVQLEAQFETRNLVKNGHPYLDDQTSQTSPESKEISGVTSPQDQYQEKLRFLESAQNITAANNQTLLDTPGESTADHNVLLNMNPAERLTCLRDLTRLLSRADPSAKIAWPESGNVRKLLVSAYAENPAEFNIRTFKMFLDPVPGPNTLTLNRLLGEIAARHTEGILHPRGGEVAKLSSQVQTLRSHENLLGQATADLTNFLPLAFERFDKKF